MLVAAKCTQCGGSFMKERGQLNRALRAGPNLYCNRECAGLGRRVERTLEEKKRLKSAYDYERIRGPERQRILDEKRAYHQRTYDPVEAAEYRRTRMPLHVEYCRRPEYRAWKRDYDRQYRAKQDYGPLWETHLILMDLEGEIDDRADRYEIYQENGRLARGAQKRKRQSRQAHRAEPQVGPVGHAQGNSLRLSQCGRRRRGRIASSRNPADDQHAASDCSPVQPSRVARRDQVRGGVA